MWQLSIYTMKDSAHYNINKKEINNDIFEKGKGQTAPDKKKEKRNGRAYCWLDHSAEHYKFLLSTILYLV